MEQGALNGLGIRPRTPMGLLGIFFSPFLHRGLGTLSGKHDAFLHPWLVCDVRGNH
jgi:hypothetical protein